MAPSAIAKLFDIVVYGIDALGRPWIMRRVASGEGERLEISAVAEVESAREHVSARDAKRRTNVERIVLRAFDALRNEAAISNEPVDDDWIARFFSGAHEVSNADLQQVWSLLLAREVTQPGSVPPRTIDVLRNLSPSEAQLFDRLRIHLCATRSQVFLPAVDAVSEHLHVLQEAGIVGGLVQWGSRSSSDEFFWAHGGVTLGFRAHEDKPAFIAPWTASAYLLTSAGASIAAATGLPSRPCRTLFIELLEQHNKFLDVDVIVHDEPEKRIKLSTYIADADVRWGVERQR